MKEFFFLRMESSRSVTAWVQGKVLSLSVTNLLHMCDNGHVAHTKNTCSFMLPSSVVNTPATSSEQILVFPHHLTPYTTAFCFLQLAYMILAL